MQHPSIYKSINIEHKKDLLNLLYEVIKYLIIFLLTLMYILRNDIFLFVQNDKSFIFYQNKS